MAPWFPGGRRNTVPYQGSILYRQTTWGQACAHPHHWKHLFNAQEQVNRICSLPPESWVFGEILSPSKNKWKSPDSPPCPSSKPVSLQMSSASTTHQLPGSWEPSLFLSALWTSASNPLVTLHLQTRPLLFIPTGAAMSLLAWTSTTPPKWLPCFHFALSPSSKRSKNVGKVTLTLLLKHSKASHWAWNNSNSLSPTKSYMMRLVSDFPTQHWPLSSWESISLSVDWVDYLPSRLAVKPAGVGNV